MVVYILTGLIGSGKSTWAQKKAEEPNTIIVNKDAIRTMLKGIYCFDKGYEPLVGELAKICLLKALQKGFNVIIDETNLTKAKRRAWIDIIRENYYLLGESVEFEITVFPEKRNNVDNRMKAPKGKSREEWEAVYRGMKSAYEEPGMDELSHGGRLHIIDKMEERLTDDC
jgi:predicted kinase